MDLPAEMSCLFATMNRLRSPNAVDAAFPSPPFAPSFGAARPLRIIATGTLFLTHTLSLREHPVPGSVSRAYAVARTRGGGASFVLKLLMQLGQVQGQGVVDAQLVAPLAGNDEGRMLMRELEGEGIGLRFCKVWEGASVPSAWVLHAGVSAFFSPRTEFARPITPSLAADTGATTVINHNPLPDVTHEEFVSALGPLLAPENYTLNYFSAYPSPSASPVAASPLHSASHPSSILPPSPHVASQPATATLLPVPVQSASPVGFPITAAASNGHAPAHSPAPFDWLHFDGRSVKTTLTNMVGIDGLARERKWRTHCVFSLDLGRRARPGVETVCHSC
jgi:hypothetical protein